MKVCTSLMQAGNSQTNQSLLLLACFNDAEVLSVRTDHAAGPPGLRDTLQALCIRHSAASRASFHFRAERF